MRLPINVYEKVWRRAIFFKPLIRWVEMLQKEERLKQKLGKSILRVLFYVRSHEPIALSSNNLVDLEADNFCSSFCCVLESGNK